MGGGCHESIDEQNKKNGAAAQSAVFELAPIYAHLVPQIEAAQKRNDSLMSSYAQALNNADMRYVPDPEQRACPLLASISIHDSRYSLRDGVEYNEQRTLQNVIPSLHMHAVAKQRETLERLHRFLAEPIPVGPTLGDRSAVGLKVEESVFEARSNLSLPAGATLTVLIEKQQRAALIPDQRGNIGKQPRYTPGVVQGSAYLFSYGKRKVVCISHFTAQNSASLILYAYDEVTELVNRGDDLEQVTKRVERPPTQSEANEVFDRDMNDQIIHEALVALQLAVAAPSAPPPDLTPDRQIVPIHKPAAGPTRRFGSPHSKSEK
jgi:hypothetical protein